MEIKSFDLYLPLLSLTINDEVKPNGFSDDVILLYASGDKLIPFFANLSKILFDILHKIFIFYVNKL